MNSILFYPKMAVSNIGKNKKIYIPYMLMCIFVIMMYYMMNSIIYNDDVREMPNVEVVVSILNVGLWVLRIFAVIFLFYINSFLMKRRMKEIGLYNILGMEKHHIGIMMFFESLYITVGTIAAGVLLGIVFAKLMFLLLLKLIAAESVPAFDLQLKSVINTSLFFLAVFTVTYVYNLCRVHLSSAIELLHGKELGEKEPKTKILMTVIGILCIGTGYYFALFEKNPIEALNFFLLAVIFVMVGTYALFTAGSIALLKLLRKNKSFYYKTGHFMSVSGMLYRMKQNAVGLASICILSTMVLISVSTTVSMYAGMENALRSSYPSEIQVEGTIKNYEDSLRLDKEIQSINENYGVEPENYASLHSMTLMGMKGEDGSYDITWDTAQAYVQNNGVLFAVMSLDEYNQLCGTDYTLNEGEALIYSKEKELCSDTTIKLAYDGKEHSYRVRDKITKVSEKIGLKQAETIAKCMLLIVDGEQEMQTLCSDFIPAENGKSGINYSVLYDTSLSEEKSTELTKELNGIELDNIITYADNQYDMRKSFHQMYGSFLFLGMFVGLLFLVATALIIYYKQISEGFEDRERFVIMQNVGMSREEVKKTIRSQVLMVFFLPLLASAVHVVVSFRIINMILKMLSLVNIRLFIVCTGMTFLVFCTIYGIIFVVTEKTYYNIVKVED